MSWDPNQSGQGPQEPTPNPYGPPSMPTPPPTNPYGPPPNPYGPPPANPYGPPPATPYGGAPATYYGGQPGFYPPAVANPLPLGQALRELPRQYWRIATRPSAETFAQEVGKASWDIVWTQLLLGAALNAIIIFLEFVLIFAVFTALLPSSYRLPFGQFSFAVALIYALIVFISVPVSFFLMQGIIYGLAKAFGGQGSFLQQCYSSMLIYGALFLVTAIGVILLMVPILGYLVGLALLAAYIYGIVLLVFSVMASHRLSGGQASATVLIPFVGVTVLACCGCGALSLLISSSHLSRY
ncbi:Yip1 family protein [Thermogemmatispora sp.]|uniref:Yip1 family protein n=1 Tax=Thermogemmatispora sp. TaxID=1968838 RepID=UPI0035E40B67